MAADELGATMKKRRVKKRKRRQRDKPDAAAPAVRHEDCPAHAPATPDARVAVQRHKERKRPRPSPPEGEEPRRVKQPHARDEGVEQRPARPERYSFPACDADHAETPFVAYEHISPILDRLARSLGKSRSELRIYDPYYCAGSVARHLAGLGFSSVYNRNEDFYAAASRGALPAFDVLVTNPPYTADHVERLLSFCARAAQPCLLLMPSYVYCRAYYGTSGFGAARPCYLCPPFRYKYTSPRGAHNAAGERRRAGSGSSGAVTAPFVSFWYLKLPGQLREVVLAWWREGPGREGEGGGSADAPGCTLAASAAELPHAMRDASDPSRRRQTAAERKAQLAQKRAPDGRRLCTQCGQIWGNCRHTK